LMLRKLRSETILYIASLLSNSIATFRSSNKETSGSLGDRERFLIRPHDSSLEQTADLQEKNVDDAMLKDLPKLSPPPKRSTVEPDLILVTSSSEPSGPKRHVSPNFLSLPYLISPISSPRG
jgi:hypothetical protein